MTIVKDASAPLVVVVGCTGVQGGSVVRELARSDRAYRVRGLTRDTTKPAAQALTKDGVELYGVTIALDNEAAVKEAFCGADIAFLVTNFWEHKIKEREVAEGKLMIDAAIHGGAKRVVWSGLQSFAAASGGRYSKVDHFESKWLVTVYGRERTAGTDVVFVNVDAGQYASNYNGAVGPVMAPKPRGDGTYVIRTPTRADAKIPIIDMAHDYGLFVRLAIEGPEYAKGGEILTASEMISMHDLARQLSEVTGKTVVYEEESPEDFKARLLSLGWGPKRLTEEMLENFQAMHDIDYYCGKDVVDFKKLPRPTRTWKEYAASADWTKVLS